MSLWESIGTPDSRGICTAEGLGVWQERLSTDTDIASMAISSCPVPALFQEGRQVIQGLPEEPSFSCGGATVKIPKHDRMDASMPT